MQILIYCLHKLWCLRIFIGQGSGSGDFDVALNGTSVSASRTFDLNFNGLDFFAAYADVTGILAFNGNGTYTLSELDLTAVIPSYCGGGTNFGGWSVTVIYEDLCSDT